MNVAFKQPEPTARSLDSIAEALLLPTGIDGVYARTEVFEQVVDGLSALISRYREPATESVAVSAGDEPPAIGEIGLPQELPAFSRLRELPCRRRSGHPLERRALRGRRGLDRGPFGRPISFSAPPPAIRSIRWSRAAARCPPAAFCSTSPATASAASRQKCSTGCNPSACANMSASARPRRSTRSAGAG